MNVEALIQLRDWIASHPKEHDQMHWYREDADCGTTYCAAGYVATVMLGYEPIYNARFTHSKGYVDRVKVNIDGESYQRSISSVAATHLGLTLEQEEQLFAPEIKPDAMIEYIDELVEEVRS